MPTIPDVLIEAIRLTPDDPAPRLAAADWLEEQGDPLQAEFVRAACAGTPAGRAREAELLPAVLAALGLGGAGAPRVTFRLGFACAAEWFRTPVPAGSLDALAGLPLLASLRVRGGSGGLGVGDLPAVARLRRLESLELNLDRAEPLTWAEVEPLAELPDCRSVSIRDAASGRVLLDRPTRTRLDAARRERARADPAGRAAEVRRALARATTLAADGGAWVKLATDQGVLDAALALPNLRGLALSVPNLQSWTTPPRALRSLTATGLRVLRSSALPDAPELREALLAADEWRETPGLGPWFAGRPLAALSLEDRRSRPGHTSDFLLDALAHCRGLRVLHLSGSGVSEAALDRLELPELLTLSLHVVGLRPTPRLLDRCPKLRVITLETFGSTLAREQFAERGVYYRDRSGWKDDRVSRALAESLGRPEALPGVSLRVPEWFAREPTPPPDPRHPGVEPIARWREWGTPADDDLTLRPARVVLDRLRGPVGADETNLWPTPDGAIRLRAWGSAWFVAQTLRVG